MRLLDGFEPLRTGDSLEVGFRFLGDQVRERLEEDADMRTAEVAVQALKAFASSTSS